MKLKLRTQSTETLRKCFSQIHRFRKFVILRFSPDELLAILADVSAVLQEPQVWCKFPMRSIFSDVEVHSMRDNVILLEINIELFLQTLRNFDTANSRDFVIHLQRKEGASKSRTAYLALNYSETTNTTISHTFRIPVKILKGNVLIKVPELRHVDLMMKLPHEFSTTFRRLDKFRSNANNDRVIIRASRANGGCLQLYLEEAGNLKVVLTWKAKLELQEKAPSSDSLGAISSNSVVDGMDSEAPVEIILKLRDWRPAQRIVGNCNSFTFLMCHNDACVIHCVLDDAEEVEMIYYVSGIHSDE